VTETRCINQWGVSDVFDVGQTENEKNPGGRDAEGREYGGLTCNAKTVDWFEKSEHIRWLRGPTEMYMK
jgi:hypothetical protein